MPDCDLHLRNVRVFDGSGAEPELMEVAICSDRISDVGHGLPCRAAKTLDANGLALAPGFIDVHTHDDIAVLRAPEMLPKISQGVTTVIVGNCGISASPVTLRGSLPDPMNLLGEPADFQFPTFAAYAQAIREARPSVNVDVLVGHTALRNNHMDRIDRAATDAEASAMRAQLEEALAGMGAASSAGIMPPISSSSIPKRSLTPPLTTTRSNPLKELPLCGLTAFSHILPKEPPEPARDAFYLAARPPGSSNASNAIPRRSCLHDRLAQHVPVNSGSCVGCRPHYSHRRRQA